MFTFSFNFFFAPGRICDRTWGLNFLTTNFVLGIDYTVVNGTYFLTQDCYNCLHFHFMPYFGYQVLPRFLAFDRQWGHHRYGFHHLRHGFSGHRGHHHGHHHR